MVAGILLGVVLSLLTLIDRISHPPDAVLREVPGQGFHDVGETAGETLPGLLVGTEFPYAPLLFSNGGYFFRSACITSSRHARCRCAGFCWMRKRSPGH